MFLVEREPGNVAVYNSPAELSKAIREGGIGPTARIYHRRSSQWLPITEHPTYRQVRAEAELEPLPPMRRRHWTFLPHAPSNPAAAHETQAAMPEGHAGGGTDASKQEGSAEQTEAKSGRAWWRMSLRRRLSRGQGEPS